MRRLSLLVPVMIFLLTCGAYAHTWYVTPNGSGDPPTIQAGIDSAGVGDTVVVACGTYYEHDITVQPGICLVSETGAPDCVTIDAQALGRVFICDGVDSTTHIKGFTVTGGHGTGATHHERRGGGIRLINWASPRLTNLALVGNTCESWGGGLFCDDWGSPVLENVRFEGNSAPSYGGGMYAGEFTSLRLNDVVFIGNTSGGGGGMTIDFESDLVLTNALFIENSVDGWGGGLNIHELCQAQLSNVEFHRNEAVCGGGLAAYFFGQNTLVDCGFYGNTASDDGGAVYCREDGIRFESCTFVDNTAASMGGAIYDERWPSPRLIGCTLVGNEGRLGGGVAASPFGGTDLSRTIIAYSKGGRAVYSSYENRVSLSCCDLYGNVGGDWAGGVQDQYGIRGNFSACPSFCNAAGGDFHLCDESPCLPGNHPDGYDCGLIGAWGEGCSCGPTQTKPTTWGSIKTMYR